MSLNELDCDRRTVLKTTGAVGLVGASGLATASDSECAVPTFEQGDYVVTDGSNGSARGYDECPNPSAVVEIENGICGYVRDRCCTSGEWYYLFDGWDRLVWIPESDLDFCRDCSDPAFGLGDVLVTDGANGFARGIDGCPDAIERIEIDNGICGEVRDRCCRDGVWYYRVALDGFDDLWWIVEPDLSYCISPTDGNG